MWEVLLGGAYSPYPDDLVQRRIEAAYGRGDPSVKVRGRGSEYEVRFDRSRYGEHRQRLVADTRKTRRVRRVALAVGR